MEESSSSSRSRSRSSLRLLSLLGLLSLGKAFVVGGGDASRYHQYQQQQQQSLSSSSSSSSSSLRRSIPVVRTRTRTPESESKSEPKSGTRLYSTTASASTSTSTSSSSSSSELRGLNVAIVGAGPSGLLLAHLLLNAGCSSCHVYERRERPSPPQPPPLPVLPVPPVLLPAPVVTALDSSPKKDCSNSAPPPPPPPRSRSRTSAYALGVGRRGRTAIQHAEPSLWQAISAQGFSSERFHLHLPPPPPILPDVIPPIPPIPPIRLRDREEGVEPSLLLFQSDLCSVLAEQLEQKWKDHQVDDDDDDDDNDDDENNKLKLKLKLEFDCKVTELDLKNKQLTTTSSNSSSNSNNGVDTFDLVVGCDGVNSIVRGAMDEAYPAFECTKEAIPGILKVVRLNSMPPLLDPTAVALVLPKAGSVSAFVEPTAKGSCCILFAGQNATDVLFTSTDAAVVKQALEQRWPLLLGGELDDAAAQLTSTKNTTQSSLIKCNTFHYGSTAVLVGDAAHATGGVSGQGVNSALVDSAALADSLKKLYNPADKEKSLRQALLAYSQKQVPEGKALYELSFGPTSVSLVKRAKLATKAVIDTLFKGRLGIGEQPLRTLLTTSLRSFADVRRDRDGLYDEPFPDEAYWKQTLAELDASAVVVESEAVVVV